MMYVGMIETRFLKILLKSFHENYSDLLKKQHGSISVNPNEILDWIFYIFSKSSKNGKRTRVGYHL